jgi:hypothetical protein
MTQWHLRHGLVVVEVHLWLPSDSSVRAYGSRLWTRGRGQGRPGEVWVDDKSG